MGDRNDTIDKAVVKGDRNARRQARRANPKQIRRHQKRRRLLRNLEEQ